MVEQKRQCGKCSGEMIAGLAVTQDFRLMMEKAAWWVELKLKDHIPLRSSSDEVEKYNIETYRCIKCGYLESYATERFY